MRLISRSPPRRRWRSQVLMWTASVPTRQGPAMPAASSDRRVARAAAGSGIEYRLHLDDVGSDDLRAAPNQPLDSGLPQTELGIRVTSRDHHLAGLDATLNCDETQQPGKTHIVAVGAGDERLVAVNSAHMHRALDQGQAYVAEA